MMKTDKKSQYFRICSVITSNWAHWKGVLNLFRHWTSWTSSKWALWQSDPKNVMINPSIFQKNKIFLIYYLLLQSRWLMSLSDWPFLFFFVSFGFLLTPNKNKSKENSLTELKKKQQRKMALWKYEMPFGQRKYEMGGKIAVVVLFVLCFVIYYVCLLKLEQYA